MNTSKLTQNIGLKLWKSKVFAPKITNMFLLNVAVAILKIIVHIVQLV